MVSYLSRKKFIIYKKNYMLSKSVCLTLDLTKEAQIQLRLYNETLVRPVRDKKPLGINRFASLNLLKEGLDKFSNIFCGFSD